jgi:hypothetical protein
MILDFDRGKKINRTTPRQTARASRIRRKHLSFISWLLLLILISRAKIEKGRAMFLASVRRVGLS